MLTALPKDTIAVPEFANKVDSMDSRLQNALVIAVGAYKTTSLADMLVKKTFGTFGHHYIIAEVREPGSANCYFARIEFQGGDYFGSHAVAQTVTGSDDRDELCKNSTRYARLENMSDTGGLTLGALATLLRIIYNRTSRYDVFSRNCIWFTETILYSIGRGCVDHWLAGNIEPADLRGYVDGSLDAITVTSRIIANGDETTRGVVDFGLRALNITQSFFSSPFPDRILARDEEIGGISAEWKGH